MTSPTTDSGPLAAGAAPITAEQAKTAIIAIRASLGVGGWLLPRFSGRLFGLKAKENPASPYLARLFAVRELALIAPLFTEDDEVQRRWLTIGIGVDATDAVASLLAGSRGYLTKRAVVMTFVPAVATAVLGWLASRPDD